jgi:hypothetical protein
MVIVCRLKYAPLREMRMAVYREVRIVHSNYESKQQGATI